MLCTSFLYGLYAVIYVLYRSLQGSCMCCIHIAQFLYDLHKALHVLHSFSHHGLLDVVAYNVTSTRVM